MQCFVAVTGPGGSPATVTAVIAKTYDVNGFDPSTNTADPAIAGAEVTLTINQKSSYLQGVQRVNPDTSRYHTPQWVYSKSVSIIVSLCVVIVVRERWQGLPQG